MKCVHCGAPITMEDKHCPYCGEVNELFAKHQAEMQRYASDYEKTAQEVGASSRKFAKLTGPIIAVAALLVLNVLMLFVLSQAGNIGYKMLKSKANRNADTMREQLYSYLDAGDYLSFEATYNAESLYVAESLRDINAVEAAVSYFRTFRQATRWAGEVDAEDRYEQLVHVAEAALDLYQVEEQYSHYDSDKYLSEQHRQYIHEVQESCSAILQTEFGMTPEQIATINDYSASKLATILEEGMA